MVVMSLWINTVHILDIWESLGYLFFKRQQMSDWHADFSCGGNMSHPLPAAQTPSACTCLALLPLHFAHQGREETVGRPFLLPGCQWPALFGVLDGSGATSFILSLKSLPGVSEETVQQKTASVGLAGSVDGNNRCWRLSV